jgi:hypothetical protein
MSQEYDFEVSINKGSATARLTPLNPQAAQYLYEELFVGEHTSRDENSIEFPYKDIQTITRNFLPNYNIKWNIQSHQQKKSSGPVKSVIESLRTVMITKDSKVNMNEKSSTMMTISLPFNH